MPERPTRTGPVLVHTASAVFDYRWFAVGPEGATRFAGEAPFDAAVRPLFRSGNTALFVGQIDERAVVYAAGLPSTRRRTGFCVEDGFCLIAGDVPSAWLDGLVWAVLGPARDDRLSACIADPDANGQPVKVEWSRLAATLDELGQEAADRPGGVKPLPPGRHARTTDRALGLAEALLQGSWTDETSGPVLAAVVPDAPPLLAYQPRWLLIGSAAGATSPPTAVSGADEARAADVVADAQASRDMSGRSRAPHPTTRSRRVPFLVRWWRWLVRAVHPC